MKIIKKDGRLENFQIEKIKTSINNATLSCKSLLNESDLKVLCEDIKNKINTIRKDGSNTSSYEVIGVVIDVLKDDKFSDIISLYLNYKKN
ncbi:ATP cone domain-containing protein [Clostridium tarantellae]|uniref:ATP-cone domain-containing protein n=1 Tax=Clostridium tarantellae TaxID=39493 RepID=A0A6I1ML39_9CLOT|nr:ATP cone domain-containing protein [Clostridium tarantellae]MPQ44216.1 hypothetical protein [Clostridium tarantellae]